MSTKRSTDRRVRRSRQWLQDALKALVQEKDYEAITVLDLAARADVNRTTFYQHFRDKDELLDSIISDLLEPVFAEGDAYMARALTLPRDEAPPFILHLFERIGADAAFYRRMLGTGGSLLFIRRMVLALRESLAHRLPTSEQGVPPGLTARYLAMGMVGALAWWLDEPVPRTPRQAADWTWQLTFKYT